MKKLISLCLCLCTLFAFVACDSNSINQNDKNSKIAQIVLDYEYSCKQATEKLREENPDKIYFDNYLAEEVHVTYVLNNTFTADEIIEKHNLKETFGIAKVSALNAIKMISLIFDRDYFTEEVHNKIKQIKDEESAIESLFVDMERINEFTYMPNISYYCDNASKLEYNEINSLLNLENSRDFIIKSKEEYDAYIDDLLEINEYDYLTERIHNQRNLYDDAFFSDNAIIITKVLVRGSGSISLTIDNVYLSDGKIYVVVKTNVPSIGDAAMQYKNFALIVKKSEVLNINKVITLE